MKNVALTFASFVMVFPACAAPLPRIRPVSIAAAQQLKAPLTLSAVERAFGRCESIPGPCFSYPCSDGQRTELVFWYHTRKNKQANYEIAYITFGPRNEPPRRIVWPAAAAHSNPSDVLEKLYDENQNR